MHSLRELADRAKRKNITLVFSHVNEQPMCVMEKDGFIGLVGKENFHSWKNKKAGNAPRLLLLSFVTYKDQTWP